MNERKKKLKRFLVSFLPLKNFLFSFFDHRDLRYKLSVRYTYQTPGKKRQTIKLQIITIIIKDNSNNNKNRVNPRSIDFFSISLFSVHFLFGSFYIIYRKHWDYRKFFFLKFSNEKEIATHFHLFIHLYSSFFPIKSIYLFVFGR